MTVNSVALYILIQCVYRGVIDTHRGIQRSTKGEGGETERWGDY